MLYATEVTTQDELTQIHKINQLYLKANLSIQVIYFWKWNVVVWDWR